MSFVTGSEKLAAEVVAPCDSAEETDASEAELSEVTTASWGAAARHAVATGPRTRLIVAASWALAAGGIGCVDSRIDCTRSALISLKSRDRIRSASGFH